MGRPLLACHVPHGSLVLPLALDIGVRKGRDLCLDVAGGDGVAAGEADPLDSQALAFYDEVSSRSQNGTPGGDETYRSG